MMTQLSGQISLSRQRLALRALFPAPVAVALLDAHAPHSPPLPEETPALAGATSPRQNEFTGGRAAARRAMAGLGLGPLPIPSGPDRAPIWPQGLVGSISHTADHTAAAVAQGTDLRAIGLDLEPEADLDPDLWTTICLPGELRWLDGQPLSHRGKLARLIFSAKESAYKCQYPLTRILFGFDRLRIEPDLATHRFEAIFTKATGPFDKGTRLPGRFSLCDGLCMTAVTLAHAPALHRHRSGRA